MAVVAVFSEITLEIGCLRVPKMVFSSAAEMAVAAKRTRTSSWYVVSCCFVRRPTFCLTGRTNQKEGLSETAHETTGCHKIGSTVGFRVTISSVKIATRVEISLSATVV